MNVGKSFTIFKSINSKAFSDNEKLEAIEQVVNTHMNIGIQRNQAIKVIRWLMDKLNEIIKEKC